MSNKFFSGRKGRYIFCDICGQACYVFEAVRLKHESGRPGLIVCPNDADTIDYSLIPYVVNTEKPLEWTRMNHQNITNGAEPYDIEESSGV
jgi:hypothetical protein